MTILTQAWATTTIVGTHKSFLSNPFTSSFLYITHKTRQVQFYSENLNPCSSSASQNYLPRLKDLSNFLGCA